MRLEFHFLDYVWKSLVISGAMATIAFTLMWAAHFLFRQGSARQLKWFFNFQYVSLTALAALGLGVIAWADPDLGCFNAFVQNGTSYTLTRILAGIWLTVVLALMAYESARHVLASNKKFRSVTDEAALSTFKYLQNQMAVRRPIRFQVFEGEGSPFVFGLFSDHIVVPERLLLGDQARTLQHSLAHEFVHVRDADCLWAALELLVRRIFFFHPLAYLTARLYTATVEQAADEAAVTTARLNPLEYIQSLIKVAELSGRAASPRLQMNASRGFLETRRRIERISSLNRGRQARAAWPWLAGLSLISIGLSMSEATSAIADHVSDGPAMCVQVNHEKMLEAWLRIETEPARCEKVRRIK